MTTPEHHNPDLHDDRSDTPRRRCPVCWAWFTPNPANNPNPRRYCSPACRAADHRRRSEAELTQLLLDAKLELLRALRYADQEHQEHARIRHQLADRRPPMNTD